MASRHYGLKFGRFVFEFGISDSAGSVHGSREPPFPIWRGTTALLERYYRASGIAAYGSRYYHSPYGAVLPPSSSGTIAQAICLIPSFLTKI